MERDWPRAWFDALDRPRVRGRGVVFPTWHRGRRRACYVMGLALERLAGRELADADLLDAFDAHRRRLHAAAHAALASETEREARGEWGGEAGRSAGPVVLTPTEVARDPRRGGPRRGADRG